MSESTLMGGAPRAAHGAAPAATARRIRVLVADDSALIRQTVRRVLDSDPELEVIDTARDGLDALLKVESLQPDVVTLDVEMPRLDGLSALKLLMERFPRPVIMFSSLTAPGTEATVRALALGAVDFLCKPTVATGVGISALADELVAKVKRAARARVRRITLPPRAPRAYPLAPPPLRLPPRADAPERLLVIGSSTGGPRALAELTAGLPPDLSCAGIIVQHLPAGFTRSLAERLDQGCALRVAEAQAGAALATGQLLVAPGDYHLSLAGTRVVLDQAPRRHGVRPSVDTTLEAAAEVFGPAVLAVILTGMGEDGTEGARAVKAAGGRVLAEAESTCVVYGMPRAVVEAGLADEVVPLDALPAAIVRHLGLLPTRGGRRAAHA
jgi:two-component system chemotaxis response regulator CheB